MPQRAVITGNAVQRYIQKKASYRKEANKQIRNKWSKRETNRGAFLRLICTKETNVKQMQDVKNNR